jgi:hypothetical protein
MTDNIFRKAKKKNLLHTQDKLQYHGLKKC